MAHLDERLVAILQCPVCRADEGMEYKERRRIVRCLGCERTYPVVDGIPVLLAEEAAEPRRRSGS